MNHRDKMAALTAYQINMRMVRTARSRVYAKAMTPQQSIAKAFVKTTIVFIGLALLIGFASLA